MLFATLVLGVLALGPQAVLSRFKFSFSNVTQCGPVSISFYGDDPPADSVPISILILPFNSFPISIPIPNASTDTTGVYVTFLPLAAGTKFVASLDDATGDNSGKVTDVIKVLPSPTDNSTCLPIANDSAQQSFNLHGTPSQCHMFNISYDPSIISRPPSVRVFTPEGGSSPLNQTTGNFANGTATYLMSVQQGKEAVLMFDDGRNHRETSQLFTIGGDSTSGDSCLSSDKIRKTSSQNSPSSSDNSSKKLSKGAIIGIVVGVGSLIIAVMALGALYVVRERRRRHGRGLPLADGPSEKKPTDARALPQSPSALSFSTGLVRNPPYTAEKFSSPTTSAYDYYLRNSMSSWKQVVPDDQRYPASPDNDSSRGADNQPTEPSPLTSLDIERILEMATIRERNNSQVNTPIQSPVQSTTSTPKLSDFVFPPNPPHIITPAAAASPRFLPSRGHLRDPSDIPSDPSLSMTLSAVFPSPFNRDSSDPTSQPVATDLRSSMVSGSERLSYVSNLSHNAILDTPPEPIVQTPVVGLPMGPRNMTAIPRHMNQRSRIPSNDGSVTVPARTFSRDTAQSWGDWYGVAR